jgi:hypothetical protein
MNAPKRLIRLDDGMDEGVLPGPESQTLISRVLKMSQSDAANVAINSNVTNNLRFAANQVSTAGSVSDISLKRSRSSHPTIRKRCPISVRRISRQSTRGSPTLLI